MPDAGRKPAFFWLTLLFCAAYIFLFAFSLSAVVRHYGVRKDPGWRVTLAEGRWVVSSVNSAGPAAGRIERGDRLLAINGDERSAVLGTYRLRDVNGGDTYRVELDVGCFGYGVGNIVEQLPGWEIMVARDGELEPYRAASLAQPDVHSIWCRPSGSEFWVIEILVEEGDGTDWIYRRDARIRRPVTELVARNPEGIPYLRPEVQLLYKSKLPRPKDTADFVVTWPLLSADMKAWLASAVRLASPSCLWEMSA